MRIRVASRGYVYINDNKINAITPNGSYSRDLYSDGNVIVKLDWNDFSQSYYEIKLWKKMLVNEKIFFVEPLDYGYILEDGKNKYWIAQNIIKFRYISPSELIDHKDYGILRKIEKKYGLCDVSYNDDNFGLDENYNIKIWDYGL